MCSGNKCRFFSDELLGAPRRLDQCLPCLPSACLPNMAHLLRASLPTFPTIDLPAHLHLVRLPSPQPPAHFTEILSVYLAFMQLLSLGPTADFLPNYLDFTKATQYLSFSQPLWVHMNTGVSPNCFGVVAQLLGGQVTHIQNSFQIGSYTYLAHLRASLEPT